MNTSQEWGLSQDLLIGTLTQEALHTWLEKGISNVAFLGIGLGIDNLASCAFLEAKVRTTIFWLSLNMFTLSGIITTVEKLCP